MPGVSLFEKWEVSTNNPILYSVTHFPLKLLLYITLFVLNKLHSFISVTVINPAK